MHPSQTHLMDRWARTPSKNCCVCGELTTWAEVLAGTVALPRIGGDSANGYEPYHVRHSDERLPMLRVTTESGAVYLVMGNAITRLSEQPIIDYSIGEMPADVLFNTPCEFTGKIAKGLSLRFNITEGPHIGPVRSTPIVRVELLNT